MKGILCISLVVFLICFILYGFSQLAVKHHKRNFEKTKLETKQEGEIERKKVFYDEHGTYYLMDIPINKKRHEYLVHKPGGYSSESMTHYPECKYCKMKREVK